jgi:predicted ATP-grasp superfamily ATP-dependent carboligase
MLIFVYEYTCATKTTDSLASLRTEGWAMLSALVDDLSRIPGIEVISLLDHRQFPTNPGPAFRCVDSDTEERLFRELAAKADFTLVIAPEFDDILAQRCQWVEESGGRLLGPSLAAVRLTADKYALGQYLHSRQLPTPQSWLLGADNIESVNQAKLRILPPCPAVLKPRFGAGSLATFLVGCPEDLSRLMVVTRNEGFSGNMILQPLVPGKAVSVAFLMGPKQRLAMPAASQDLSEDGRFHHRGGYLPLPVNQADRARRLATRAIDQVSGLLGYVGVDLVLGPESDGSQDYVIEINPRLTTSYIGLRALAETNLAEALLNIAIGKEVALKWRSGRVQFHFDGRIIHEE